MSVSNKPTLEYAQPAHRKSGVRAADLLTVILFLFAAAAGGETYVKTQHRPLTQARLQYETARVYAQATQPSFTPPPYAGRTFEDVPPWGFASTYVAIALALAGMLMLALRLHRPTAARGPHAAGSP